MKFGGTSVGSPAAIKKVGAIVRGAARKNNVAVVVSAFAGVTDALLECAYVAARNAPAFARKLEALQRRHLLVVKELVPRGTTQNEEVIFVKNVFVELSRVLRKVARAKKTDGRSLDAITSTGEILSARIVAAHISGAFVDARRFIKTDDSFTRASVDFAATNARIRKSFRPSPKLPVITGFIGATSRGETTTLGRGGSDYTASIFGAALGVKLIEIWTDVSGIMSADPRIVPTARTIPRISYDEAVEAAYFGAKVIHPATMLPAIQNNIPILVKNTFAPTARGTQISKTGARGGTVKAVTSIEDVALVNVGGVSLMGIPGSASRVFETTAKAHINVILISQASSEHTICLAIKEHSLSAAIVALQEEFAKEILSGQVRVSAIKNQAIIAAVGGGMRGTPGIAGKLFSALGANSINISAIAQGGSERNISCVVNAKEKNRAIVAVHDTFLS